MKTFARIIAATVRSPIFFACVVVLFVAESGWIAWSARYPMAFDEAYHLGIIKLYAHQLSPFFTGQPPDSAAFGALTRDPSYLYHWAMSFPYRWFSAWFTTPAAVIVALRCLNIALFAGGLVLFRRVLLQTKTSAGLVHSCCLFFVLIPVVPLLAAHINYDNALMLLVPLNLLLLLRFRDQLQKNHCNIALLASTISLGLLASLVKFAYLPIMAAIVVYLLYIVWEFTVSQRLRGWQVAWQAGSGLKMYTAVTVLLLSSGLFVQMYGVNLVRYHNVVPQCGQVLGVEPCLAYSPWARNYTYALHKTSASDANPVPFLGGWLYGMFLRSFFAINGPGATANYDNKPPPPVLAVVAVAVFGFGVYLVFRYRDALFRQMPVLVLLLFVSFAYIVALMARNYHDYLQLGQLVAINGRYLVPVILPILLTIGLAYQRFLSPRMRSLALVIVVVLFLQGGGALGFIHSSTAAWYWPDNRAVLQANTSVQRAIKPFILGWP